jgi:hypothetical protein
VLVVSFGTTAPGVCDREDEPPRPGVLVGARPRRSEGSRDGIDVEADGPAGMADMSYAWNWATQLASTLEWHFARTRLLECKAELPEAAKG